MNWKTKIIGLLVCLIGLGLFIGCKGGTKKGDKELFEEFYNRLKTLTSEFDELAKPFFAKMEERDLISAITIAKRIKWDLQSKWLEINNLKIPGFKDKQIKEEVKK